uniref:U3 small nucleolar RNA-associated protein 20 domain-containing protein n=1 Tax=Glossina pallidipes TaxID=7398 RepID=A0A1A9Z8I5_GLOPL
MLKRANPDNRRNDPIGEFTLTLPREQFFFCLVTTCIKSDYKNKSVQKSRSEEYTAFAKVSTAGQRLTPKSSGPTVGIHQSKRSNSSLTIEGKLQGCNYFITLYTGASHSIINSAIVKEKFDRLVGAWFRTATGEEAAIKGKIMRNISISDVSMKHEFMVAEIMDEHLGTLIAHLHTLLTRGFQVHVLPLGYRSRSTRCVRRDVENCSHNLLQVSLNNIFGEISMEKEVDKLMSHTPEEKPSAKSYLVLDIIARNIGESCLLDLLMPFKDLLAHSKLRKMVLKIRECFSKIESITELLSGTQPPNSVNKKKSKRFWLDLIALSDVLRHLCVPAQSIAIQMLPELSKHELDGEGLASKVSGRYDNIKDLDTLQTANKEKREQTLKNEKIDENFEESFDPTPCSKSISELIESTNDEEKSLESKNNVEGAEGTELEENANPTEEKDLIIDQKKEEIEKEIEIEDPDDYLLYLEIILRAIHVCFYSIYYETKEIPDLNIIGEGSHLEVNERNESYCLLCCCYLMSFIKLSHCYFIGIVVVLGDCGSYEPKFWTTHVKKASRPAEAVTIATENLLQGRKPNSNTTTQYIQRASTLQYRSPNSNTIAATINKTTIRAIDLLSEDIFRILGGQLSFSASNKPQPTTPISTTTVTLQSPPSMVLEAAVTSKTATTTATTNKAAFILSVRLQPRRQKSNYNTVPWYITAQQLQTQQAMPTISSSKRNCDKTFFSTYNCIDNQDDVFMKTTPNRVVLIFHEP